MDDRWSVEQVAAAAPTQRAMTAAEPVADPARWAGLGADDRALWGRYRGSRGEPYETFVDHVEVAWRCTCPSRQHPCKHALGLLLAWVRGVVPVGARPAPVATWLDRRRPAAAVPPAGPDTPPDDARPAGDPGDLDKGRDERIARMRDGLVELDRWLEDRLRTGLADPALASYATWDHLAARLVDARAGSLANRVRRIAGLVGAGAGWHADVLAEFGLLHLIASAGLRIGDLPGGLADAASVAAGWQVRQADVLVRAPEPGPWLVAGRSDTREDRIEVRRWWLRSLADGSWAMALSFAAYQQALDTTFEVGARVDAELHRYPGGSLRVAVGRRSDLLPAGDPPAGVTIAAACDEIGDAVAAEPWLERYPAIVRAAPTVASRRWVLTDDSGSLPLLAEAATIAVLLAAGEGGDLTLTVEWSPWGVRPLAVHLPDRTIDVGPRADPSFVATA